LSQGEFGYVIAPSSIVVTSTPSYSSTKGKSRRGVLKRTGLVKMFALAHDKRFDDYEVALITTLLENKGKENTQYYQNRLSDLMCFEKSYIIETQKFAASVRTKYLIQDQFNYTDYLNRNYVERKVWFV
jgi:hypothetical protein